MENPIKRIRPNERKIQITMLIMALSVVLGVVTKVNGWAYGFSVFFAIICTAGLGFIVLLLLEDQNRNVKDNILTKQLPLE